ncbi:MAG: hypothetical protein U0R52_08950 [Solirubrobacterales bacterium]
MAGGRIPTVVALIVVALLALGGAAGAASSPTPPTGAWKLNPGGGFTLKRGKGRNRGRIYLSNYHGRTGAYAGCPSKPTAVTVLGRYPLKRFTRAGYTAWGVGRNSGGDATPRAGKVKAAGKTYNGSFYLVFDYSNPRRVIGGSIQFGSCLTQFLYGSHK